MLVSKDIRQLRRQTMRPMYPIDEALVAVAGQAHNQGAGYYETIKNPTTHQIYRYLCAFTAQLMLKQTGRPAGQIRILDWGGGKGYVAYFLQQRGFDVTLYETKAFPHRIMWEAFALKTKTSSGSTLPFADASFDAVVGFGVLEHVPYDYDALKEVNRVLKDDGLFCCFNLPSRSGYVHYAAAKRGVRYHDRLYGSKETRQLLKRSGFNLVGRPWHRQLFPKNSINYKHPVAWERLDLLLCRYTPLAYAATSLEFIARKQYTYTSIH